MFVHVTTLQTRQSHLRSCRVLVRLPIHQEPKTLLLTGGFHNMRITADSTNVETWMWADVCWVCCPSFVGSGLEDGHVPTSWLQKTKNASSVKILVTSLGCTNSPRQFSKSWVQCRGLTSYQHQSEVSDTLATLGKRYQDVGNC